MHGSDSINAVGNYSNNTVTGNDGDNILAGLPGADTLTGGSGADRFVYRNAFDSHLGDSIAYYDQITDFNPSEDIIQLPSGSASLLKKLESVAELTHASISDGFVSASIESHDIVLFEVGQRAFIVANDSDPAYSAKDDVLIEVTGTPLDSLVSTNFEFA